MAQGVGSTRWTIVWLLTLISVVRSMDAVNFSVAAKQIMPEYGLTNVQMGLLYTAFTLGYALFHIPGGWMADSIGPRRLLTAAVLWWSLFTGITSVAAELPLIRLWGPFYAFMLVRFLVGLGEGAAYPGSIRMLASWMAADERAAAGGLVFAGVGIGYSLAPPLVAWLMVSYGWRVAFYAFSAAGILLAILWRSYATDLPEAHPRITQGELKRIRGDSSVKSERRRAIPWRRLLTSPEVRLLAGAGFCLGYSIYIYQSWFYLYLVNIRGFSEIGGGVFATAPFIAITLLSPVGGLFSDALVRRYGKRRGRKIGGIVGFLLSAVCVFIGARATNPYLAVLLLALGDGILSFAGASGIATTIDIAGEFSGVTYGLTVVGLQIGGALAPTLTPLLAERFGWEAAFYMAALLAVGGALFWLKIDAGREISSSGREDERRLEDKSLVDETAT